MTRRGFTLIEVLIAGAIFAQVTVVGTATMASIYRVRSTNLQSASQQEAMRSALETIGREIHFSTGISLSGSTLTITKNGGTTVNIIITGPDAVGRRDLTLGGNSIIPSNVSVVDGSSFILTSSGSTKIVYIDLKLNYISTTNGERPDQLETIVSFFPRGWSI